MKCLTECYRTRKTNYLLIGIILVVFLTSGFTSAVAAQGSSFDDATVINEGTTAETISDGGSDFYRFEANTTDAIDASLTPQDGILEFYIYDRNREEIAGDGYITEGDTEQFIEKLPRNETYYIEVTGYNSDTTSDYTLNTDIVTPTENDIFAPNDEFDSAVSINQGTIEAKIWGGESDFYQFDANTTDAIKTSLTPQGGDLEYYIYDRNREAIVSDGFVPSGDTSQLIEKLPRTGTYYIEVTGYYSGTTSNYTLSTDVITPSENDAFAPNDNFDSAVRIQEKFTDAKIWGGESDFYQFDANTTDAIDARLTPQGGDLEYYVYDRNREVIVSDGFVSSGDTGRITKKLPQNSTYYIEITGYYSSTTSEYTINTEVITPSENDKFAPNHKYYSAAEIKQEFSDAKIWGGESDFYRVGLTSQEEWTVDLTPEGSDMEFRIYNPNLTEIASDPFVSDSGDQLSITASESGTYYLEVTAEGTATTEYTVQSTQTGDENTLPVAAFATSSESLSTEEPVSFDASESNDVDGNIMSYEWDFDNDGVVEATSDTPIVSYEFDDTGNYTVTLTVTDDRGGITTTTDSITIQQSKSLNKNVEVDDVSLTPTVIKSTDTTHSLTFDVANLSADNRSDKITITLPEGVEVDNIDTVTANKFNNPDYEIINGKKIKFSVNPSNDAEIRSAEITVKMALSPSSS